MTGDAVARARSNLEVLRRLPLFAELPEATLSELCRLASRVRVPAGGVVMEQGTPGDGLHIIVDGELEVTKRDGEREVPLAVRGPGEFLGEMSLLEQAPRSATVRALRDSELLVIRPTEFQSLLAASPTAAASILQTMAGRLRSTEASLMEQEKLASLGTLAAGLAHELNNPAAAIIRAADHMGDALETLRRRTAELGALGLSPDRAEAIASLEARAEANPDAAKDALAASEAEDDVADWLEARGIPEGWELAPALAAGGWTGARLDALAADFEPDQATVVVRWLAADLAARGLLAEIETSARAISGIVRAVKTYAYLDQAPVQDVDVAESLETTLVILRHKLKDGIRVERDFAPDLPRIEAFGSELNQVWTNLIDNAIQAMGGTGTIGLAARPHGDHVIVEITDSGPGIPAQLRDRIFDPFFTTKPPGVGTGLGLHITYNIIVNRHRGRIAAEPGPERGTTFRVRLPVRIRSG